jgi:hypothetical protein
MVVMKMVDWNDLANENTDEEIVPDEIIRRYKIIMDKTFNPRKIDLTKPTRYYAIDIKGFKKEKILYITELHNRVQESLSDDNRFIAVMNELENNKMEYAHNYKEKVIARCVGKCDRLILSNKLFDCYDTLTGYTLILGSYN